MKRIINKAKRAILRKRHASFVKRHERHILDIAPLVDVIRILRPTKVKEELIRVGSPHDGGYLLPASAADQDVLLSPGVSWNSRFELFFADHGTTCHLFDASVEKPTDTHENFHFYKKFWGTENSTDTMSATDWISTHLDSSKRNALQMDVEGAEYDIISSFSDDVLKLFNLIVLEVHQFHNMLNPERSDLYQDFFRKLTRHHRVVHFHPNNNIQPTKFHGIDIVDCFELTMVRRDYPFFEGTDGTFAAHQLDMPCVPEEEEIRVNWDHFCTKSKPSPKS